MKKNFNRTVGFVVGWMVLILIESMFLFLIVNSETALLYRILIAIVSGPVAVYVSAMACMGVCKTCRQFHISGIILNSLLTILALFTPASVDIRCMPTVTLITFVVAYVLFRTEKSVINWEHKNEMFEKLE